jgi:hypothetical protein
MNRLVLHHVYNHGLAFDTSGSDNHGNRVDVTPGSGTFAGSLQWSAGDSAVLVSLLQLAHLVTGNSEKNS